MWIMFPVNLARPTCEISTCKIYVVIKWRFCSNQMKFKWLQDFQLFLVSAVFCDVVMIDQIHNEGAINSSNPESLSGGLGTQGDLNSVLEATYSFVDDAEIHSIRFSVSEANTVTYQILKDGIVVFSKVCRVMWWWVGGIMVGEQWKLLLSILVSIRTKLFYWYKI